MRKPWWSMIFDRLSWIVQNDPTIAIDVEKACVSGFNAWTAIAGKTTLASWPWRIPRVELVISWMFVFLPLVLNHHPHDAPFTTPQRNHHTSTDWNEAIKETLPYIFPLCLIQKYSCKNHDPFLSQLKASGWRWRRRRGRRLKRVKLPELHTSVTLRITQV